MKKNVPVIVRYFSFIFLTLLSLSFSISKAEARTYDFNLYEPNDLRLKIISDNYDNIQTMISTASSSIPSNLNFIIVCTNRSVFTVQSYPYDFDFNGTTQLRAGNLVYSFLDNYTSLSSPSYNSSNFIFTQFYQEYNVNNPVVIYTSKPYITNNPGNVFNFSYYDKTFVFDSSNSSEHFPTLLELYNYFYGDNTPLLTSFYTITIDKLAYICDYIVSNYVFLAIFTIFILYFVILLIRRLS